ncbi:MAG: protein translocase subunit SecD [Dehalococcoidia bacterium]|nr:protein translocase subunit SecD [Dehalococcoidia bacterium]
MARQIRSLIFIAILIAIAAVMIAIPKIKIGGFERGNEDAFLGLTLGLDLQGGTHLVYRAVPEEGQEITKQDLEGVRAIIEKRVNAFGVSEPTVQLLGNPPDRVVIQLPGLRGASITSEVTGGQISVASLQSLLRDALGHPEATVEVTGDVSNAGTGVTRFVMRFNELRGEDRDIAGNLLTPSEGERIRKTVEGKFPTVITVQYLLPSIAPTPEATVPAEATGTPAAGVTAAPSATPAVPAKLPTIDDIRQVMAAIGRSDAAVAEVSPGRYTITIAGLKDRSRDADGKVLPSDDENLRDGLRPLGEIQVLGAEDRIVTWTVGGGVQEAKKLIGSTAQLEFLERICGNAAAIPAGIDQFEWETFRCSDPRYYTEQSTAIAGSDLTDAFAGTQPNIARPVVNIVFNEKGADEFFKVTDRISRTGDLLAIYLDGQELVAPRAATGISGGRAFIQGPDFTAERARTIAIQLRSGALPVKLELIQERNVDATLGSDSLRKTLIAGAAGMVILFFFMSFYYKIPGIVASLALVIFTVFLIAIFKSLPVTMTLAGAAAFILSLGMAVDANVLIAERTKEELRAGRPLFAALSEGFNRSWPSIRDGNIATIIIAAVLFWFGDRFGTSLMQGFALTLGVGTLLSMLTSITVSRVLLRAVASTPLGKHPNLFVPVRDMQPSDGQAAGTRGS